MGNGCERSAKSGATGALLDMQPGQGLIRPSPQSNERDPLVLGHAVGCPRGYVRRCARRPHASLNAWPSVHKMASTSKYHESRDKRVRLWQHGLGSVAAWSRYADSTFSVLNALCTQRFCSLDTR